MTFEATTDYELVRQIITHPKLYPWVVDDFSPSAENFRPSEDPRVLYVLVREGAELLGLFMFVPQSPVCWEVHTCLLPCSWGERARIAGRKMAEFIWNVGCARIITSVPAYNRLALRYAKQVGMVAYGRNPKSFLRHGQLHDQILLGMSKEDK